MASLYDYMSPAAKKVTGSSNPYEKYQAPKLPTSNKNNITPTATKGMTMASVAAASKNPSSKSSSSKKSSSKKSSNKSSSKVNTSQRTLADLATNTPYGVNEGAVKNTGVNLVPTKTRNNTAGNLFRGATNFLKRTTPLGAVAGIGNMAGMDISSLLGIDKALASDSGLATWQNDQGQVLGVSDPQIPGNEPSTPDQIIQSGQGPIQYPGVTDQPWVDSAGTVRNSNTSTNLNSGSNRTKKAQPVTSPFSNPYQELSAPVAPQSSMYSPQSSPDYGNSQTNERTMRGMGGQGIFSKGTFSNGSGDYGFQGTMGTEGGTNEQDWINQLLGINTAEAGGFDQYNPYTQVDRGLQSSMDNITPAAVRQSDLMNQAYQAPQANYGGGSQGMGGAQVKVGGNQQANESFGYDQQMKQQENSFKQQQKAQEKALKELIKSITNQYKQTETETKGALQKQNQEDMLKLSGLFGFANQDPNSEQRLQYEQRAQNDYQTQLANALTKLGTARAGDISGAKQNYQSQIAQLAERRAQAIQAIQQAQQQQAAKMAATMSRGTSGSTKAGKPGHAEIFDWVNGALEQGGTWDEIAQQARANGIDTSTGSYLDQLLNNANKQGRWA